VETGGVRRVVPLDYHLVFVVPSFVSMELVVPFIVCFFFRGILEIMLLFATTFFKQEKLQGKKVSVFLRCWEW